MSDYTQAPATKMLATHCVCCGRPLVDSISVEMGIGPECRNHENGAIDAGMQKVCNEYVFDAAIAAQEGRIEDVLKCADTIESIGLTNLADKVRRRFKQASVKKHNITIELRGGYYVVRTPYRRGDAEAFKQAWRGIPGRRWSGRDKANLVPVSQKAALWGLLREFFAGKFGNGPKGVFRIPQPAAPAPKPVAQPTLVQPSLFVDPGNRAEYELARQEMATA